MTKTATPPRLLPVPPRYVEPLLNERQASIYLGCSTTLVELFVDRHALAYVDLGDNQRRYRLQDLEAFAAARVVRHVGGRVTIDLGKKK